MNKRFVSLIAALLVAIMLVPSIALAETPTITMTGGIVGAIDLPGSDIGTTYQPAGLTITVDKLTTAGKIEWVSDNVSVVKPTNKTTNIRTGTQMPFVTTPWLTKVGPGTAFITGTLFEEVNGGYNKIDAVTFMVTLNVVKETAATFRADPIKVKLGGDADPIHLSNYVSFPAAEDPTYGVEDISWKISPENLGTLDTDGDFTPAAEGTVTATGTTKGAGITGNLTITILPADSTETTVVPYTTVTFTHSEYTVDLSQGTYSLTPFYTVAPADASGDDLEFFSSNEDVAYFKYPIWHNVRLYLQSKGDTVVTVKSKVTGTEIGKCTIHVTEEKPAYYKTLKFQPDSLTFYLKSKRRDVDYLTKYLNADPADPANDELIWESDNTAVAKVDQDGEVDYIAEGEATITVKSKNNKDCAPAKIKVKVIDKYYTKVSFSGIPAEVNLSTEEFNAALYVTTEPANAEDSLTWVSSKPEVAEVNASTGKVTLKKEGTVTIVAKSKKNPATYGSFDLKIVDDTKKDITKITLIKSDFSLKTNDPSLNLSDFVVVEPKNYSSDDGLVFSSADPSIVRVSEDGVISFQINARKNCLPGGPVEITVRTKNGKADPQKIKVTHEKDDTVKTIKFVNTPEELKKRVGTLNLSAYLQTDPSYYADEYIDDLVWTSDKPEYAFVKNGCLTYVKPGATVTITAASKDGTVSDSFKIKTTDVPVTAIKFANEKLSLKVGEEFELSKLGMTVEPADADYSKVEWASSDPDILKIEKGKLVPLSVGTVTITAGIENAYNEVYGTFEVEVTENSVTSIKFAKKEYTKKISNEDVELTVYFAVKPYNAKLTAKDFTIQSSDRNVADVKFDSFSEKHGMYSATVTFSAPGTAKITVRSADNEKVYGSTKVTAEAIAVKKVKLPKKSMKLFYYNQGETHEILQNYYKLSYKIQPSNAWYKVTWETTNPGVAFVKDNLEKDSEKGVWIVATGAGTATITMNVDDGINVRQAKMKVIVVAKTVDLKLNKKKATITMIKGKDNTVQLIAYDPVTEDAVPVKWSSSNKKVATVDKNGLVKALKAGEATITATTKDGNETTATCVVTVEKKLITSLKAKSSITLKRKETKQLSIKIKPSDAYNTKLSFKSSDEKVATVDANGLVKGIAAGEAIITVKTNDGSKLSLEILVTVTK